jgi:hypothetical protein
MNGEKVYSRRVFRDNFQGIQNQHLKAIDKNINLNFDDMNAFSNCIESKFKNTQLKQMFIDAILSNDLSEIDEYIELNNCDEVQMFKTVTASKRMIVELVQDGIWNKDKHKNKRISTVIFDKFRLILQYEIKVCLKEEYPEFFEKDNECKSDNESE